MNIKAATPVLVVGILCVTALALFAVHKDHDGLILSLAFTIIGAAMGIRLRLRKK